MKLTLIIFLFVFNIASYGQSEEEIYDKGIDYLIKEETSKIQLMADEEKIKVKKLYLKSAIDCFNQIIQSQSYSHLYVLSLLKTAGAYDLLGDSNKSIKYYRLVLNFNKLKTQNGLVADWKDYSLYKNWAANGLINHFIVLEKYDEALKYLQKEEKEYRLYVGATCGTFIQDQEQAKLNRYLLCYIKLNRIDEAFQIVQAKQIEVNGYPNYNVSVPLELYIETIKKKFSKEEIKEAISKSVANLKVEFNPEMIERSKKYEPYQKQNIDVNDFLYVSTDFFGSKLTMFEPNKLDINTASKKFIIGEADKDTMITYYKEMFVNSELFNELQK